MDTTLVPQSIDFLEIAVEEIESGDEDVAREFVAEVYSNYIQMIDNT